MAGLQRMGIDDARCFARVAFGGRVVYRYGGDDRGIARAEDVSRGGMRLTMGRYLRPGTHILIETPGHHTEGQPIELKGKIVWCVPEQRGARFSAGIRVIYDEPDAVTAASALVNHAIVASGMLKNLRQPGIAAQAPAWIVLPIATGNRSATAPALAGNA